MAEHVLGLSTRDLDRPIPAQSSPGVRYPAVPSTVRINDVVESYV